MDYVDKFGKPIITTLEWSKLLENRDYSRVGSRVLANGYWVSTVWLGLNHRYDNGPGLYFETMVFKKPHGEEIYQERYTTLHQAEQGHEAAVDKFMPWYQKLWYWLGGFNAR